MSELPITSRVQVYRVPKEGKTKLLLVGPTHGILTHWQSNKGISYACPGSNCKDHNRETTWKGYCCALRHIGNDQWLPCVFEVTERFDEYLEMAGDFIGCVWECWREKGRRAHREVVGKKLTDRIEPLPCREFVILPVLIPFYRAHRIEFDVPRPTVALPPVEPIQCASIVIPLAQDLRANAPRPIARPTTTEGKPVSLKQMIRDVEVNGSLPSSNGSLSQE
jgi:hypothetical protein